jgi:uncharacterized metal-binding protein YceD (DUF177 family)
MTPPEFSRPVRIDSLGEAPRALHIEAEEVERITLARRFGLVGIARLAADLTLSRRNEEVTLGGTLSASVTQACIASGEPLVSAVETPFEILFRPQLDPNGDGEEIELSQSELDIVFYDSGEIDVGEAVAETLALNLDPWPRAPDAEQALKAAGVKSEEEAGPFGALAALRDKLKGD